MRDEYLDGITKRFLDAKDAQSRVDLEYAEDMGYDAGKNGANDQNSHFAIFSKPEFTKAWERGKKRAEDEKRSHTSGRRS